MKKTFKIIFGLLLILIISIYIGGLFFFTNRYMPRTYINGRDFGLVKKSELKKTYEDLSRNFELEIISKDKNLNDKIAAKDFGYVDSIGSESIDQTAFYWPVASLVPKHYKVDRDLKFDAEALDEKINKLKPVMGQKDHSQDAKVIFEDGEFKIQDEIHGNFIKMDEFKNSILGHFGDLKGELDLAGENLYQEPKITKDSEYIKNQLASYKDVYKKKIIFDFDDRKEEVTGQGIIAIYSKADDGTLALDEEKLKHFVERLAAKYDTYRTSRIFNSTGLGLMKVDGGIYGWLTDRKATREKIKEALAKEEPVTIKPAYRQDAVSRKVDDVGNTYIEVDLARQKLWYYKDGVLQLETNVVTGNPTKGNGTPTGTDRIWSRERDRYLTGETYRSKVSYWAPINWSGVGLHDASWRSNFGGNIYKSGGSHGCVNIPVPVMKNLFPQTFAGMPVIVYNSATQRVNDAGGRVVVGQHVQAQANQGQ
ncbi:MAG: L,D-transpeptidase family protein [Peptoniphilus harei]|uniref:L,D-TPase catalytic domain-containing protein n=1 Tax=Peptoniphilus harei ACS-146-V-Sch2b TaxID=908338 RepID=E4KY90_9FIRM|nr:L,D-transpeptidase family protein [Peptoniphilus harei]EFR33227.1 conserved hypothetical protein [Peptoniphilus harei ACS-146-V-Sch2b]MDK7754297.1 L,D-transpeptidase family protein [Peptoniphilus harei]MDK7760103.1 L,D-transpeptidase family protein [Peptoniphilus harei]MDK8271680.1 L,D-transpeptidase family protein [Peptoniphilus harei]MDK8339798.1 L,D-transpeptidase family protein [Peptoniphilus harei]